MEIADVDKQRISWQSYGADEKGDGTIVLLHGNSCSSLCWSHLLEHDPGSKQVITLDLPGHGRSGKAPDPLVTYSMKGLVQTVVAFIERLKIKDVILVGHSLGGHIAIGVAAEMPLKGIFIFGTPPLETVQDVPQAFNFSNPDANLLFQGHLSEIEAARLAQVLTSPDLITELSKDILDTDMNFRSTFAESIRPGCINNEKAILKDLTIPVAVVHGENDPLINLHYIQNVIIPGLWRKRVITVKAGHSPHMENSKEMALLLRQFVQDCQRPLLE